MLYGFPDARYFLQGHLQEEERRKEGVGERGGARNSAMQDGEG